MCTIISTRGDSLKILTLSTDQTFEMDRKRHIVQFNFREKTTKPLYIGACAWILLVSSLTCTVVKHSALAAQADEAVKSEEESKTSKAQPGFFGGIVNTCTQAFESIQAKVDELRRADEENGRLRLENAHLRLLVESGRFERYAEHSEKMTHETELKLGQQTDSRVGRTLASIAYHAPTDLPPKELYGLGLSYFRARDDEKAAVILTFLTGLEDDDRFRTPPNLILTGIAWYRLEHFEKAEHYFDEALKVAHGKPDGESATRQGLLWKGLVAERIGKHEKSQAWLHEVLDQAPRSSEAALINHGAHGGHEVSALPASVVSKTSSEVAREPARARE
jgi:tetratricopeptide (TPR) repeat protein